MKKPIYILLLVFSFANGFSQGDSLRPESGTLNDINAYQNVTVKYPQNAKEQGYMGRPLFSFIVDTSGIVKSIKTEISSGSKEIDNEGIRAISKIPKSPIFKDGRPVERFFYMPIYFILHPMSPEQEIAFYKKWKIKYADYYFTTGVNLTNKNRLEDALVCFENGLTEINNDIDLLYNKAAVQLKLKRKEEACKTLFHIKSLGKNDADELITKHCEGFTITPPTIDSSAKFTVVEKMPEYPGGMQNLMTFIEKNITYPNGVKKEDLKSSKIFVKFVIDRDGSTKDTEIIKGSGNELVDAEAKRLVSIMPKWNPGIQNDKAVPVYFNLPISFSKYR